MADDLETWEKCRYDAVEALEEIINGKSKEEKDAYFEADEPHDDISQEADSGVPIYNADLMNVVRAPELCHNTPELGHGTAGNNPLGVAQAVIYEALEEALWEKYREMRDEWETEKENEEAAAGG